MLLPNLDSRRGLVRTVGARHRTCHHSMAIHIWIRRLCHFHKQVWLAGAMLQVRVGRWLLLRLTHVRLCVADTRGASLIAATIRTQGCTSPTGVWPTAPSCPRPISPPIPSWPRLPVASANASRLKCVEWHLQRAAHAAIALGCKCTLPTASFAPVQLNTRRI